MGEFRRRGNEYKRATFGSTQSENKEEEQLQWVGKGHRRHVSPPLQPPPSSLASFFFILRDEEDNLLIFIPFYNPIHGKPTLTAEANVNKRAVPPGERDRAGLFTRQRACTPAPSGFPTDPGSSGGFHLKPGQTSLLIGLFLARDAGGSALRSVRKVTVRS